MRIVGLAAIIVVSTIIVSGQAFAQPIDHAHTRHAHVCKVEHRKTKVHGKWVVKDVKVCR